MKTIKPDDVFSLAKHAKLKRDLSGDTTYLVLPEKAVKLNNTALSILNECDGNSTVFEIVDNLKEIYGEELVEEDVTEFLEQFFSRGWIKLKLSDSIRDA